MKFPAQKEKVVEEIPENNNINNIFPLATTTPQPEKFNTSQNFSHPQTSQLNSFGKMSSISDEELQKITPFPLPSANSNEFQPSSDTDSHSSSSITKSAIQ